MTSEAKGFCNVVLPRRAVPLRPERTARSGRPLGDYQELWTKSGKAVEAVSCDISKAFLFRTRDIIVIEAFRRRRDTLRTLVGEHSP
jgi:hypothetical protein